MIQMFAHSFRQREDVPLFEATLIQLKRNGIDLPMQANSSPVFTPPPPPKVEKQYKPVSVQHEKNQMLAARTQAAVEELSEIEVSVKTLYLETKSNLELLQEMLRAIDPKMERVQDNDIVQQLLVGCKTSQGTIQSMIESGSVTSDNMLEKFLVLNDDIQQALELYEKVAKGEVASPKGPKQPTLIDFEGYSSESDSEGESPLEGKKPANDPFMFAIPTLNAPPNKVVGRRPSQSGNTEAIQSSLGGLTINSPPTKNIFDDEFAAIANRNFSSNQTPNTSAGNPFDVFAQPSQPFNFPSTPTVLPPINQNKPPIQNNPFVGQNPFTTSPNSTQSQTQKPFDDLLNL
jgi:hypothetical protein